MKRRSFDHEILLFQGGGALGAYQAGIYEGLAAEGMTPNWFVGISIGAVNATILAGNPPERRVERLREFWDRVSSYAPLTPPAMLDSWRPFLDRLSVWSVATFGISGFFVPRVPSPLLAPTASPEVLSLYDTSPLKKTFEELVDFDLINEGHARLSLGAVNVRNGESVYFDNRKTRIAPEHVLASGALPPGFPAVEIDGEEYWDGGLVSNTPLHYVWDQKPLTTALHCASQSLSRYRGVTSRSGPGDGASQGHSVFEQTPHQYGTGTKIRGASFGPDESAAEATTGLADRSRRAIHRPVL